MDKEISPLTALIVIVVFLLPIAAWIHATEKLTEAHIVTYYLESTPNGRLSVQANDVVFLFPKLGKDPAKEHVAERINLSDLGVEDLQGNISYYSDEEFLIRTGTGDWGIKDMMSRAEARDQVLEESRQNYTADAGEPDLLAKCHLTSLSCEPYLEIKAPWRYRLNFDTASKDLYISYATKHKIVKYDAKGEKIATLSEGVKFPKRVRKKRNDYYFIDTNNHRVAFFDSSDQNFGKVLYELRLLPPTGSYRWMIDAVFFGDSWWVINADGSMMKNELQQYDNEGNFLASIALGPKDNPFDMLVYNNELLVNDRESGRILRLNKLGDILGEISSPQLDEFVAHSIKERNYYESMISGLQLALAIMFLGGVILAFVVARKHDKKNPKTDHKALPTYLNKDFKVTNSSNLNTPRKEIIVNNILISNIEIVPGMRTKQHLGLVQGSTVRAKHAGKDILAGLKNIFGGELKSYTDLLSESRQEAIDRMTEQAQSIGANAILNVRFSTSSIAAGASEIFAYGTAVVLEEV